MGRHVFVSYSRKDQAYTRELAEDLRRRGFQPWVDDRIDYGEEWWRTIVQAIRSCAAFVVVMTPDSEESDWVEREVQLALRESKAIFPVLLRGREFPLLITTQYVNVTDGRMPPRDFYQRLAQAISVVQQRELAEMYGQAQAALGEKRHDEAERLLTEVVDRDASYKDASSLLIEVGELKYRGALQADPENLKARVGLASLLLRRGDLSQAAEEYEKALDIDPQDHAAKSGFCQTHLALGDQLREEDRIEEAVEYYGRILSVNGEHQAARDRVAAYHVQQAAQWTEEQKLDEAVEALERAVELTPEDEAITTRLAQVQAARRAKRLATLRDTGEDHLAAERWEQAIACFEEYLSSAPEDDKMAQAVEAKLVQAKKKKRLAELYAQAEAALSQKRYIRAARLLREVLKLEDSYKDAPRLLAQALEWQGQAKPRWKDVRVLGGAGGFLALIIVVLLFRLPSALGPGAALPGETPSVPATATAPTPAPTAVAISPLQTLLRHTKVVQSVAFDPGGSILASGSFDASIRLWQVSTGTLLRTLIGEGWQEVESVAFSPDGQILASGADDGAVRLWRVSDGTLSKTLAGHTTHVNAVAFSPDGAILASGLDDGTVILWDTKSGEQLRTLETGTEWVEAVAFSPAESVLATAGQGGRVMLWGVESGVQIRTLGSDTNNIASLAFSPDGVILASGSYDSTVALWDVESGQCLQTLVGHTRVVRSVAFSPDGGLLASGSLDKTVMVWDVESGQAVCILEGHTSGVHGVAFSPDGRTLASGSEDRTVRLWDTTPCLAATGAGGRAIVVTSAADSGTGTLRQVLLDAQRGDIITFDPSVFPPGAPVTISFASALPQLGQGYLTIDASDAGVILDGSNIGTTPETTLLDDINLTLDGGPNLIANGDFTAGLGHWRPYPYRWTTLTTRTLESSDFTSPPCSLAWSGVAREADLPIVYDTAESSEPWPEHPYETDSTAWIRASGGSTAQLRLQYKGWGLDAGLIALYQDGHPEEIATAHLERRGTWGEGMLTQVLPAETVAVAVELRFSHPEGGTPGLGMNSPGNTIRGLQITNFPQAGIALWSGARNNMIGGDQDVGAGPLGQGNLLSANKWGIALWDASSNTIRGNYIGTDLSGTRAWGNAQDGLHLNGADHNQIVDNLISSNKAQGIHLFNRGAVGNTVQGNYIGLDMNGLNPLANGASGIFISEGAAYSTVGPDNVIAYNGKFGVEVSESGSVHNIITRNGIYDNGELGIDLGSGGNTELVAPSITAFDLSAGTVEGAACANCTVEIFSDSGDEGAIYEGSTIADDAGAFYFSKGPSLVGPHLTATATDAEGNTSEFSVPAFTAAARLRTLQGHTDAVRGVAFSPDGRILASGSADDDVILWDVESGRELRTLEGHTSTVESVAFSPDGQTLASGAFDLRAILWDVQSGRRLRTLQHGSGVEGVAFSPDGQALASAVAAGPPQSPVMLWDVQSGQALHTLEGHTSSVNTVAFSPDGKTLVSGSDDGTVRLWDVESGEALNTLEWLIAGIENVAFSPDGKMLAWGGYAPRVIVWEMTSGRQVHALEGHTGPIGGLSFSPDGAILASGSYDSTVILWDVQSGQRLSTLEGHTDGVRSVAFSPDGRILASGSLDETVILWDVQAALP